MAILKTPRRGPPKPKPKYTDDPDVGTRTGKVIPKKPRGDDGLENFEAYFDDDGATSPSINGPEKAARPSSKRRSSVALSDAGSDMDLTGSALSPDNYITNAPRPAPSSPTPAGSISKRLISQGDTDFDAIPSPGRNNRASSRASNLAEHARSKSLIPRPTPRTKSSSKSIVVPPAPEEEADQSYDGMGDEPTQLDDPPPVDYDMDGGEQDHDMPPADPYDPAPDGSDSDPELDLQQPESPSVRRASEKTRVKANSRVSVLPDPEDEPDVSRQISVEVVEEEPMEDPPVASDEEAEPEVEQESARKARSKAKGKGKALPEPVVDDDMEDEIARGLQDIQEEDDSDNPNDSDAPSSSKKVKTPPTKAEPKKRGRKPKQKGIVEDKDTSGLRRSTRTIIPPLEYWRLEKDVWGRAEEGSAPLPILKDIIRYPKEIPQPLGIAGKKRKRRAVSRALSRAPSSMRRDDEELMELGPPEAGWDEKTIAQGTVVDYKTREEIDRRVAFTAAMMNPTSAAGNQFAYQKIYGDDDFIASGVLTLPVHGEKPLKGTKDNTYVFWCHAGAVKVRIHKHSFIIAPGGTFMVPRGNQYHIANISQRETILFFAQARKVPTVEDDGSVPPYQAGSVAPGGISNLTPRPSLPPRLSHSHSVTPNLGASTSRLNSVRAPSKSKAKSKPPPDDAEAEDDEGAGRMEMEVEISTKAKQPSSRPKPKPKPKFKKVVEEEEGEEEEEEDAEEERASSRAAKQSSRAPSKPKAKPKAKPIQQEYKLGDMEDSEEEIPVPPPKSKKATTKKK